MRWDVLIVTEDAMREPNDVRRDCSADCDVPGKRPDVAMLHPLRGGVAGAAAFCAALRGGIGRV